jgi:hypothetical protein
MADLKISQLTAASTPLAGTEVLPIVQSGSTKKVSVADLTAGRAVAMAGGSFTDNITQSTAAKGFNFTANTPAAGMTSQLLNWYEEGTFTAGFTCGSGSVTLDAAFNTLAYTRIGRQVTITGYLKVDTVSSPSGALTLTGLPFTIKNANSAYPTGIPFMTLTGAITGTPVMLGYANTTTVSFRRMSGGTAIDDLAGVLGAGSQIIFTFVYIV